MKRLHNAVITRPGACVGYSVGLFSAGWAVGAIGGLVLFVLCALALAVVLVIATVSDNRAGSSVG